ncbi:hypothetical protein K402DRAFT_391282 [Aulographum hederae CBS 113979]|uniref:Intramembrane protease 2 n=1 Tax=Aulographum hederae CBS 113979 TaxID=1176131 RepID=A0A6G1H838_9PEZI|nr:hypothetical protein K402DRAFT_391282 [Aulographum hederae CBS 113979]
MAEPSFFAQILGRLAFEFSQIQPLIPTYTHLLLSALFPIFTGAHASLSRPSSAAKPVIKEEDAEEEDEEVQKMEGLSPSDAIMFPILAGSTLAALYFLIQWLQDPAFLNKVLNWYFAVFGCFSVTKLLSNGMELVHSLFLPQRYIFEGYLWELKSPPHKSLAATPSTDGTRTSSRSNSSPLPGILSLIPLPFSISNLLWAVHDLPRRKWALQAYVHRLVASKTSINVFDILGLSFGILSVLYFNLVDKPWFLTNLMGFGFSYGAMQLLSPTTFTTGSLILSALFFYDIYFVFYTPMMVTVAKSLDIPIKLVFPRPQEPGAAPDMKPSHAMLGLGDVILPGIMIGLALRFDLYMHYRRMSKHRAQKSVKSTEATLPFSQLTSGKDDKVPFVPLRTKWSDLIWLARLPYSKRVSHDSADFPKPYFYASLAGYTVGMLTTLGVMQAWGHAQPALLYLVPGVLGSLWLTALIRGELKAMWNFSEAEEDENDKGKGEKDAADTKVEELEEQMDKEHAKHLVYFSVSRSKLGEKLRHAAKEEKAHGESGSKKDNNGTDDKGTIRRSERLMRDTDGEPTGKRQRVA